VRTSEAQVRIPSRRLPGFRLGLDGRAGRYRDGLLYKGFSGEAFRALSALRLKPWRTLKNRSRTADLVEEFRYPRDHPCVTR
jgi:hypothetical protein